MTPRSPSRRTPKLVNAKLNAPRVKGYQVVTETDTKIISSLPQTVIRGDDLLFDDPKPGFADGWKVEAKHNHMHPNNLTAYAICVSP